MDSHTIPVSRAKPLLAANTSRSKTARGSASGPGADSAKAARAAFEVTIDPARDALLSAFQNLAGFEGGARLSTWLHRITVNAALMRLRSKKRRREDAIEELLPAFAEDGHHLNRVNPPRDAAEDEIASAEISAIVRAAIDELPDGYRVVLVLRDVEGLDTAGTAAALGIGPDAAKMRLHRARQALRTLLDAQLRELA